MSLPVREIRCSLCDTYRKAHYTPHEGLNDPGCSICQNIEEKYPDLFKWISLVVEKAIEEHSGKYQHDWHDE